MSSLHSLNIAFHIAAGAAAIAIGFAQLALPRTSDAHRRRGQLFAALTLAVSATAAIGSIFFRFIPLFAVLAVLVPYQLFGGWHAALTRAQGPNRLDALMTLIAAATAGLLLPALLHTAPGKNTAAPVIYASLGALLFALAYDTVRWLFPQRWHAFLWRYEHIYKMNAALFGMLSAASGNLLRMAQPWSQVLPSACGLGLIAWLFWRAYRRSRAAAALLALASIGAYPDAAAATGSVTVHVQGVAAGRGEIIALLCSQESFKKRCQWREVQSAAAAGVQLHFQNIPPGRYAVRLYQDENGNGKLDTGMLGLPKEPYGFSRDAAAQFGPPEFAAAAFDAAGETSITVNLKH